jgi:hypothetical protein
MPGTAITVKMIENQFDASLSFPQVQNSYEIIVSLRR